MQRFNWISALIVALVVGVILPTAWFGSRVLAGDYSSRALPDEDRQTLSEYLGNGVVGEAIAPPALPDGINDMLSIGDGMSWRVRVTSGRAQGKIQWGSASLLSRSDGGSGFRIDTGDGRNVLYGQLDAKGNVWCYASQDNREGVMSRFTPPQPIFLADMKPGEARHVKCQVAVADLSRPDVETHSGELDVEFTYEGAYQLHVPAGTIDSVLFKTRLTGKVGPATVDDTIYRFYGKNCGPVAIVETNDVSALFVYHEKTRIGKVLVGTDAK